MQRAPRQIFIYLEFIEQSCVSYSLNERYKLSKKYYIFKGYKYMANM